MDRNHPALVTIKERYPLTGKESTKQTWHVTLDLKGVELDFQPGDSLGIYPQNDPILVEHLLEAMGAVGNEPIIQKRSGKTMSVGEFLTSYANLFRLTSLFLKLISECAQNLDKKKNLLALLEPKNKSLLKEYLDTHEPLDLLREYRQTKLPLQALCDLFPPLLPRFFSVASSKFVQKEAVDLTVALLAWTHCEEKRYGVTSHFLCHLAEIGKTPIRVYVQPARHFWLPEDHHADIIMVGPGTGIAPFRAFMQERMHLESKGKSWLFFGERNRSCDFFYEPYWKKLDAQNRLRIHSAFSRDQSKKFYVQHKMLEKAQDLYKWLQNGAHFYVCGDAKQMAKDVHSALLQIMCEQGNLSEEKAKEYLKNLKKEGRYLKDVY